MSNYIGVECPVCEKKFTEGDDVVVCPICGAPHHRSCFHQLGHCALEELHISGHVWESPEGFEKDNADTGVKIDCRSCGAQNPSSGIFCKVCGAPLKQGQASSEGTGQAQEQRGPLGGFAASFGANTPNAYTMAFGGLSPDEEIDGVSARDLAFYVGPSSPYYLPRFKQISQGFSLSINFSGFLCNFFYFFYRKMFVPGALFLLLMAVIQIPFLLIMPQWSAYFVEHLQEILAGITPSAPFILTDFQWVATVLPYQRYVMLVVGLACGMFGNHIYYRHTIHAVRKIKAFCQQSPDGFHDETYIALLVKKGRSSFIPVLLVAVGIFIVYCIVSWIFLQPYWEQITSIISNYVGV